VAMSRVPEGFKTSRRLNNTGLRFFRP